MEYTELVGTDSIINEQYPKNIGNENELIVNEFENTLWSIWSFQDSHSFLIISLPEGTYIIVSSHYHT